MAAVCHFFGILRLTLGPVILNWTQGAREGIRALDPCKRAAAGFEGRRRLSALAGSSGCPLPQRIPFAAFVGTTDWGLAKPWLESAVSAS
jgi:hypothetical protein